MDAEKVMTCTVCNETYQKPKYLPCHHSYCKECAAKVLKEYKITCPECKETSIAPTGGVKDLPNNSYFHQKSNG